MNGTTLSTVIFVDGSNLSITAQRLYSIRVDFVQLVKKVVEVILSKINQQVSLVQSLSIQKIFFYFDSDADSENQDKDPSEEKNLESKEIFFEAIKRAFKESGICQGFILKTVPLKKIKTSKGEIKKKSLLASYIGCDIMEAKNGNDSSVKCFILFSGQSALAPFLKSIKDTKTPSHYVFVASFGGSLAFKLRKIVGWDNCIIIDEVLSPLRDFAYKSLLY